MSYKAHNRPEGSEVAVNRLNSPAPYHHIEKEA